MKLDLAISPCPNDTFIFYHFIQEVINRQHLQVVFADVEELNRRAITNQRHAITKLSFPAMLQLQEYYKLLSCGGAIGNDCGPILLSPLRAQVYDKNKKQEMSHKITRIAVPGYWTTARTLLLLFLESQGIQKNQIETTAMRYDEIIPALLDKNRGFDFGVIIHEERFTFAEQNLHIVQDLGNWWQEQTKLPIPLGCIAVRQDIPTNIQSKIEEGIRTSIEFARSNPKAVLPFIKKHAQSLDDKVIQAHVDLYVNDFSLVLNQKGKQAVQELFKRIKQAKLYA